MYFCTKSAYKLLSFKAKVNFMKISFRVIISRKFSGSAYETMK